jgi:hypothetical protein
MKTKEFIIYSLFILVVVTFITFITRNINITHVWLRSGVLALIVLVSIYTALWLGAFTQDLYCNIKKKYKTYRKEKDKDEQLSKVIASLDIKLSYDARRALAKQLIFQDEIKYEKDRILGIIQSAQKEIKHHEKKIQECNEILKDYENIEIVETIQEVANHG